MVGKAPVLSAVALMATGTSAFFNCKPEVDGIKYDLTELGGLHTVYNVKHTPPSVSNTSWYFNPCGSLDLSKISGDQKCRDGSQLCGIKSVTVDSGDKKVVTEVIPVAGDFDGNQSGAKSTPLEDGEGIRVLLSGPSWGDVDSLNAQIDFLCDNSKQPKGLEFVDWDGQLLQLSWKSPQACAKDDKGGNDDGNKGGDKDGGKDGDKGGDKDGDKDGNNGDDNKGGDKGGKGDDNDDGNSSSGDNWGWFTWLFILLVLGFSGYVVGSAWINYNRYGLSGVEMLPHSDALRDVPYLIRDFVKKLASTFAGGSTRGGYSAV